MLIRIYYEDTDCGGIVYHANYLKFCERARSEIFFKAGISPLNARIGFVVKEMHIAFLHPAKLGDLLEVQTQCISLKNASLQLLQSIVLQSVQKQIFKAHITLACVDSQTQKLAKIPQSAREILAKEYYGK